jgi:hypothetical protein
MAVKSFITLATVQSFFKAPVPIPIKLFTAKIYQHCPKLLKLFGRKLQGLLWQNIIILTCFTPKFE